MCRASNKGYQVNEADKAMNLGLSSLQKWLRQYRNEVRCITLKATAITTEQKRIQELEAQVKQLKQDKDPLNLQGAFFARENSNLN